MTNIRFSEGLENTPLALETMIRMSKSSVIWKIKFQYVSTGKSHQQQNKPIEHTVLSRELEASAVENQKEDLNEVVIFLKFVNCEIDIHTKIRWVISELKLRMSQGEKKIVQPYIIDIWTCFLPIRINHCVGLIRLHVRFFQQPTHQMVA